MSTIELHDFNEKYGTLLLRSWTSEDFLTTLLADPREALQEVGLDVPASTEVVLERSSASSTTTESSISEAMMESLHESWVKGLEAGRIVLVVPEVPQVDLSELADSELEGISGGLTIILCCIILL